MHKIVQYLSTLQTSPSRMFYTYMWHQLWFYMPFLYISCYIYPILPKILSWPYVFNKITVCVLGQTDRLPNTFHFSGTLRPSFVNRRYYSNVTGCLPYLKILHNKVLQDACIFTFNVRHTVIFFDNDTL